MRAREVRDAKRRPPGQWPPGVGVVHRAFTWYAQQGDHPAKLRIVGWLKRLLRIEVVIAPTRAGWMKLDLADFSQRALFLHRVYEPQTYTLITRLLEPGDCFVDIGANAGQYSLAASRVVGDTGRVVAVEADPTNFQQLLFNLHLNHAHNVTAILGAAHDASALLPFASPERNKGNARVAQLEDTGFFVCGFETASLLRARGVNGIAVAKLDIEGHELYALRGLLEADGMLPSHIIFEIWPDSSGGAERNAQLLEYLEQKGYELCLIDGSAFERNADVPESNLWARLKAPLGFSTGTGTATDSVSASSGWPLRNPSSRSR